MRLSFENPSIATKTDSGAELISKSEVRFHPGKPATAVASEFHPHVFQHAADSRSFSIIRRLVSQHFASQERVTHDPPR
jgi:hypothetical protein